MSQVIIERVLKHLDGDPDPTSMYDMAEVRLASTGEMLATCMMSDESSLETIADCLSAKGLRQEANNFRRMMMDSRRRN
jgi:hypothetical protein